MCACRTAYRASSGATGALLCDPATRAWALSPAFDVVPQPEMEAIQAIGVGRHGAMPTLSNCLSQAGEFGLDPDAAGRISLEIQETMGPWRRHFGASGVDAATIERLAPAFSILG